LFTAVCNPVFTLGATNTTFPGLPIKEPPLLSNAKRTGSIIIFLLGESKVTESEVDVDT
jgi:hypothetical protein